MSASRRHAGRVGAGKFRRPRRRGIALTELLLALAITALVGISTAALLQATVYASTTRQGQRTLLVRAQTIAARFGQAIRGATEIVAPSAGSPTQADWAVLWTGDANGDGVRQNNELLLIERNTTTGTLSAYSSPAATGDYTTAAAFRTLALSTMPPQRWGSNVADLAFTLHANRPDEPLLGYRFTVAESDLAHTIEGAVSPR